MIPWIWNVWRFHPRVGRDWREWPMAKSVPFPMWRQAIGWWSHTRMTMDKSLTLLRLKIHNLLVETIVDCCIWAECKPILDGALRSWLSGVMSKSHKQTLGLIMIASATLTSFLLFNGLNESEVTIHHNGLKANPEQYPFMYYLNIGFCLFSSITFFILGFVFLFSKSSPT